MVRMILIAGAISSADRQEPEKAQVFEWKAQDNIWRQRGHNLIGDDAGDQFGYSLSMSGDGSTVAGWDRAGFSTGYVRVFATLKVKLNRSESVIASKNKIHRKRHVLTSLVIAVGLSEDGTTLAVTSPFHDLPNGGLIDVGRLEVFPY
jgi:hypothetical protein